MRLLDLKEAVAGSKVDAAMGKVISYLERAIGAKLIKIPGAEHFKNSKETGWGIRYIIDGTTNCIRFNWANKPGNAAGITSIDLFNNSRNPTFNLHTDGISFVKFLPTLSTMILNPRKGSYPVYVQKATDETLTQESFMISEAKRGDFTFASALKDFLFKQLPKGSQTRGDWIRNYHIATVEAFDTLVNKFGEKLEKKGMRYELKDDVDTEVLYNAVLANCDGHLEVTSGGSGEEYMMTGAEQEIEEDPANRVSFSDSLEHLEGLVEGLIKGSFNALFVAGKGGTGKTQTVEDTLHAAGLRDGDGYFKNTGTASAIGIYTLLFNHRNDIILFDDSDGALGDQDARNLIKAATDTKKIRKLVWNKKSSNMIDPDVEDMDELADDDERIPKYFNFEGQIIFISNLPLDKLDPDKALRTRAFVIAINPTPEELIARMEEILHKIPLEDGLSLTKKQRENVLETVKNGKRKEEVSLRTLVRALNLAASGARNWETLVKLYA